MSWGMLCRIEAPPLHMALQVQSQLEPPHSVEKGGRGTFADKEDRGPKRGIARRERKINTLWTTVLER
jgi:hypothetical protein